MSDAAVSLEGVSKDFKFSSSRENTIKSMFTGIFKSADSHQKIQHALRDISFEIEKGEFFGIVGRNGSGKSTLLKIIAGIYQPNKGKVMVAGKLVPFIELGVGFNPELTGKENVYMNGALLGFSTKEIDLFYSEVVEFAELEKFMDKKLKNYSSGMQVRLAFSMAVRARADVLLVDEVLAVGDLNFQRKCFEYFKELKKAGITVIFITHDMNAVREYCDRAMLIDDSKIVSIGATDKITKEYSRLFQEDAKLINNEVGSGKRWGDGSARYKSVKFSSKTVTEKDEKLQIVCKVTATKDIDDLILGFTIKDAANQAVFGSNTQLEKVPAINLKEDEEITIKWEFDNIFNDGKHWVEPAIVYGGGVIVSDWWEEAVGFRVVKEGSTPYLVNPPIKVVLER